MSVPNKRDYKESLQPVHLNLDYQLWFGKQVSSFLVSTINP